MFISLAFLPVQRWIEHALCKLRAARRLRRELEDLSRMSVHDLRDIGLSHAAVAAAAAAPSGCH